MRALCSLLQPSQTLGASELLLRYMNVNQRHLEWLGRRARGVQVVTAR